MHAYSITYGVYESDRIFKTGTIGVKIEERTGPDRLKKYLKEAMSWMQPKFEVKILNWKEITIPDYERLYSNNSPAEQENGGQALISD